MVTFTQAVSLFQRGDLDGAAGVCEEIVRREPRHADALHVLGVLALQKGRPAAGAELIRRSLEINPAQPQAYCSLGNALRDLRQPDAALESYRRALELTPHFAGAHYSLGNALTDLGRHAAALASYDRALALQPELAPAHQNRGNALLALGQPERALESYLQALVHQPDLAIALANCATLLRQMQRPQEALGFYDRLLALQPEAADALTGRGTLLLELRRDLEAIACFDRVLARDPSALTARHARTHALLNLREFARARADAEALLALEPQRAAAHCTRGYSLLGLDRPAEALESFDAASRLEPQLIEAIDGRGIALQALGQYGAALAAFEQALQLKPDATDLCYRRAVALRNLERHAESAQAFAQVLSRSPDYDYARGNLLHERLKICDWTDHATLVAEVSAAVAAGRRSCLPGPFFAVCDSARLQLQCARTYVADKRLEGPPPPAAAVRHRHPRIVVAYVSADFRAHPVTQLLAGVLEQHDRRRFETLALSLRPPQDSPIGRRVRDAVGRFLDVSAHGDGALAALLRELEVDIAVDLMGFSGSARPRLFAQRPAPVQVNFLGFPGTLGASCYDYIVGDRIVIPQEARDCYSEQVVYLPECFQPNDRGRAIAARAPTRSECGLPEQGVVFCCFNSHYKISPLTFDVWMRVLRAVPGSVLWLAAGQERAMRNLQSEAERRDVPAARLIFAPRLPEPADHLARCRLGDLFLDTQPYGAHATASDALWAGLPVLTCRGDSFAGRVAASLLQALGCPELIAASLAEYESLACELARAPAALAELRAAIARRRLTTPLFDTGRYVRHLEAAYLTMWERHQGGVPAAAFAVPPLP